MELLFPEATEGESKLNRNAATKLLSGKDTFGFVLIAIAVDKYGEDLEEDPEVLIMNLEEDFSCKIPEEGRNRLQAAMTAMTTDLFYTNRNVFRAVTLALSDGDIGNIPNGVEESLDACRCMWALTEVGLLNGQEFDEVADECSDDVIDLINDIADSEGEDPDEEDVENVMKETYSQRFVVANMLELSAQLLTLGVDPAVVSEMLAKYGRAVTDID
ncbi:MAG: hypothetical protein MJZ17_05400 [Bacteroidales bacterium]|nr:hypothetical protein [Bacteroidales bacterium]